MKYALEKASPTDLDRIWEILKHAIARRKEEGSLQWQDGYPNPEVIIADIAKGAGYLFKDGPVLLGYCALMINDEPAYQHIDGKWLTNGDFVVFHRVAISAGYIGKGLARKMLELIEDFAIENTIYSIKADTNYDNPAMLKTFEKMGYVYCGEVHFRGSPRKAFEKRLTAPRPRDEAGLIQL